MFTFTLILWGLVHWIHILLPSPSVCHPRETREKNTKLLLNQLKMNTQISPLFPFAAFNPNRHELKLQMEYVIIRPALSLRPVIPLALALARCVYLRKSQNILWMQTGTFRMAFRVSFTLVELRGFYTNKVLRFLWQIMREAYIRM